MPLNYDKLREVMVEKITAIVAKECETYGGYSNLRIDIEIHDEIIFAVSHADVPTSEGMHRYGLYCYSALGFTLHYHDSNVCDKIFIHSIDNVKRYANRYFNYLAHLTKQYV